jgi:hypothetical protein
MKRFDEDFFELLNCFKLETLENDTNSVFGLSTDLCINYLNPAWFVFSQENDGEPDISERFGLGTYIGEALSGSARDYYLDAFQRILQKGAVWHHDYECSSPDRFRLYHQSVYPLYKRQGLVIVNSPVTEQLFNESFRILCPATTNLYTQETGFIVQCSNCRRVQSTTRQDVWDWVPALVKDMPANTSHSFCPMCFEYYYEFRYK